MQDAQQARSDSQRKHLLTLPREIGDKLNPKIIWLLPYSYMACGTVDHG